MEQPLRVFALYILSFAVSITDIIIAVSILIHHETWWVATVFSLLHANPGIWPWVAYVCNRKANGR